MDKPACISKQEKLKRWKVSVKKNTKNSYSNMSQAFMPGRDILEGVIVLHKTIHELHKEKMNNLILKLNFEKVYDKVKWPFLQ